MKKYPVVIIGDGFGKKTIYLPTKQYRLFKVLVRQPDRFVPYEELCLAVLGHVPAKHTWTIKQQAKNLRDKLRPLGIDCCAGKRKRAGIRGSYRWSVPFEREVHRACEQLADVA